jgi:hypothetical protein
MVHICNPSPQEAEAGGLPIQGQSPDSISKKLFLFIHTYIHIYMHVCIYIYIYIYTYIYIHTQIYIRVFWDVLYLIGEFENRERLSGPS